MRTPPTPGPSAPADERDALFDSVAAQFAAPLARLARSFEDEPSKRYALLQDLHVALWRNLADFDARIALRTWVFRTAFRLLSTHQPNSQDLDPRTTPVGKLWRVRRLRAAQRALHEIQAPVETAINLVQQLQSFDREIALLYLEGIGEPEAAEISGWSLAKVKSAYEHIDRLIAPDARAEWQGFDRDASAVSREVVQLRIQERQSRERQRDAQRLAGSAIFSGYVLLRAWSHGRGYWLSSVCIVGTGILLVAQVWRDRRRAIAAEELKSAACNDSLSFHRQLFERKRHEWRSDQGWRGWAILAWILLLLASFPLEGVIGWLWPLIAAVMVVLVVAILRESKRRELARDQARIDQLTH